MNRSDRFKLNLSRSWKFPGQIRLLNLLKPSADAMHKLQDGIIWLDNEDIAIYTSADNYIENSILTTGTYESEIHKIISFSLKPGEVALDIGCNLGLQSLRMSKIVGASGKIISFEPLDYLRKKSKRNFHLNNANNINLLPYALSDKEDTLEITIDENIFNQGTFSLLQQPTGNSKQVIPIKIGDDLEEIKSLTTLSLVKIDVEGFEFNVLKGLESTLERFRPRIIFEYDKNYWQRNMQDIFECYNYLAGLNYTFYQISFMGCQFVKSPKFINDGNLFCIATES